MKKSLYKPAVVFMIICALAGLINAKDIALIVKQDGLKVFLDTSELAVKPKAGYGFRITETGKDIINPKTGKNLGKEIIKQINGRITQSEELYCAGQLDSPADVLGKEAEIDIPKEAYETHTAFPVQKHEPLEDSLLPVWQSNEIDEKVKAVAAGSVTAADAKELILSFERNNSINVYALKDNALEKTAATEVNPLRKIISLDAADVKSIGSAQIFATVYDEASERFNTLVFEYLGGALKHTDTIPGLVKGISPLNGARQLYMQNTAPAAGKLAFTTPARLVYKDGKFTAGEKLKTYKFESIYGFNKTDFRRNGKENIIFVAPNKKLRLQFDKKGSYIETPESHNFDTTPLRVKFKSSIERLPLSIALYKDSAGYPVVAAVENKARLGMLSDTFGSYSSANLLFFRFNGNAFVKQAQADIPGVVHDIAQAPLGRYENAIIVPFTSTAGITTVLLFQAK
jgi:uncharacterized protein YrrD